jgi:phytoene dehydrogenase-like protein
MFVRRFIRLPQAHLSKRSLERFGLDWIQPEIPLAHPLDDGTAACLQRDVDLTAESFGYDARSYRNLMAPLARDWERLAPEFLQPMLHLPRYPLALARFGIPAILPATLLTRLLFKNESTRALFAGIAAHSFLPLESPVSSAFALVLGSAGHAVGWPIPRGGSQSISNARQIFDRARRRDRSTAGSKSDQLPKSRVTLLIQPPGSWPASPKIDCQTVVAAA